MTHIKRFDENLSLEIPKYLYHATYKPLLRKIKEQGLGGKSSRRMWEDSKKGVVYLAKDKYDSISYAEVALENPPESLEMRIEKEDWENNIIVLKINTDDLDKTKFKLDQNVKDNEGDLFEYHGIIPFEFIELI